MSGWFLSLLQFELEVEPRLKPALRREDVGMEEGRGGRGVNDSRDVSFTQTAKGRQQLVCRAAVFSSSCSQTSLVWILWMSHV